MNLESNIFRKVTFSSQNEPFLDLTNSKVRASPSGVGSDIPSFWNHQLNIQKHDLLTKTENLHAALETKVYTSDSQNDIFEKAYTSDPKMIFSKTFNLEHEIYDIGTEILYETCFGHNSTQNAPKSMIPVRVCIVFCVDSESAIKTRF